MKYMRNAALVSEAGDWEKNLSSPKKNWANDLLLLVQPVFFLFFPIKLRPLPHARRGVSVFILKRKFFSPVWPIVHVYPVKTVTKNTSFQKRSPEWRFFENAGFSFTYGRTNRFRVFVWTWKNIMQMNPPIAKSASPRKHGLSRVIHARNTSPKGGSHSYSQQNRATVLQYTFRKLCQKETGGISRGLLTFKSQRKTGLEKAQRGGKWN